MGAVAEKITPEEVDRRIQAFCKAHENDGFGIIPGYEFAHIVIDDYNLTDGDIQYAIAKALVWETAKAAELRLNYPEPYVLPEALRTMRKYKEDALQLLNWLLTVPDDVRAEAAPFAYGLEESWLDHNEDW